MTKPAFYDYLTFKKTKLLGGNVSKWIFDWYKVDYYQVSDTTNPVGPTYRRGAGAGRVTRGGAFKDLLPEARLSHRRYQVEAYGHPTVGFRCAKGHSD